MRRRCASRPSSWSYARPSFPAGRPLLEAVADLTDARARRLHLRYRGDDGDDVVVGGISIETRGLSGLHALRDCLPAIARCPRVVCERLSRDSAASGDAEASRCRCLACVADVLLPGHGLDRHRSHEQPAAVNGARHARQRSRLRRRQSDPRSDPRRRAPPAAGERGCRSRRGRSRQRRLTESTDHHGDTDSLGISVSSYVLPVSRRINRRF